MFVVHYLGGWVGADENGMRRVVRDDPIVKQYHRLEDVPEPDRGTFAWMLKNDVACTSCGSIVYQSRR